METAQFQIMEGKVPVLLSAPHVHPHRRPTIMGMYKSGEPYTDNITREIASHSNCFGIYLSKECDYDPNYHKERKNDYKQAVKEIIKKNKIERFIDIHGLRENQDYDIGIYYTTRFSKSLEFAYEVEQMLNRGELMGINIRVFRFLDNGQESLGEYVASKLRVPAIQLEVARYIREDENLRKALERNLSKVVEKYI